MPGRDGERSPASASLQRRLRAALTERLGYKAAAAFFAVVLWLVVSAEEPSEELVPVQLETSFDTSRMLTSSAPVVRALVAGRARDLLKLYDHPPIVRRVITDDAPDSVGVDLRPEDVYLPPDVDAIVRDVQPRTVVLVFDVMEARRLPVLSGVRVLPDSTVGTGVIPITRLEPESVMVTGPRRVVGQMAYVPTAQQTVTVRDSARFLIPLDVKRLGGAVKVRPAEVTVSVVMLGAGAGRRDSLRTTAQRQP
jgi:hypothetical protein